MRAFTLGRPGQVTLVDGAPYPLLEEPYGAVLESVAVASCSSDVSTIYGSSSKKPGNLILGHRCITRAKAIASRVRDFQVDDLVTMPAIMPDWRNVEVQKGNDRHAGRPSSGNTFGRSISSAFAEAFSITDANTTLAKLPEGVYLGNVLMCTDIVTVGFTDVEAAELKFGGTVVMLGIGTVRLVAVQGIALQGAAEIYAVGTREVGMRHAFEFGVIEVLGYKDGDIREQIVARTGERGADAVFVCGGNDDTSREAVDMVCYGIGRVVSLRHYPEDDDIGIPKFSSGRGMAGKTVHLELCRGGKMRMERPLHLVKTGKIEPGRIVTHRLKDFPTLAEGLELMRRKPQDLIEVTVRLSPGREEQQA